MVLAVGLPRVRSPLSFIIGKHLLDNVNGFVMTLNCARPEMNDIHNNDSNPLPLSGRCKVSSGNQFTVSSG